MVKVDFLNYIEDGKLQFAVIVAQYNHQYLLVKHKKRETVEFPGGRREVGETILECAKRELYEETGAIDFSISPICVYSVEGKTRANLLGNITYGMLYKAAVTKLDVLPESEIEKIILYDKLPNNWTYPEIQPYLLERVNAEI